jgi:hypothetical protein
MLFWSGEDLQTFHLKGSCKTALAVSSYLANLTPIEIYDNAKIPSNMCDTLRVRRLFIMRVRTERRKSLNHTRRSSAA